MRSIIGLRFELCDLGAWLLWDHLWQQRMTQPQQQYIWSVDIPANFKTFNERTACAQLRCVSHLTRVRIEYASRSFFHLVFHHLLIFARKNKPCPVRGMTFVHHFAEVLTIDIAQLAVARKAGFAVSYYVPPNATHLRPYRGSV